MMPGFFDDPDLTYRMSMLPFGTYADPNGGPDHLGFAVPGMISEPINALYRLAQNSVDENGNIAIPNPENPQNREDVLTGILSLYGGNALNPLTRLPENAVGMFAGRMAKTADHAALARAEDLAAKGAPRDRIWNETGWFQGPDQKWRFEIDDSGLRTSIGEGSGFTSGPIEHPGLALAYPDANVLTRSERAFPGFAAGAFNDGRGFRTPTIDVAAATSGGRRQLAAHEAQHFVQDIEGFDPGGSDIFANYERLPGEVEARAVERRLNLTPEQRAGRPPWLDYALSDTSRPSLMGSAVAGAQNPGPYRNSLLTY